MIISDILTRLKMKFLYWLLNTFYKEFGVVYHVKIEDKTNKRLLFVCDVADGWVYHPDALINPYASDVNKLILLENWLEREEEIVV